MALRMGSWGTPEFGITEKIQSIISPNKSYTSQGGSNLLGNPGATSGGDSTPTNVGGTNYGPTYTGPQGSVLGKSTSSGVGTTQSDPNANATTYAQQADQGAQDQRQRELDMINAEYEQEMSRLGGLEGTTRDTYNTYKTQAEQYYPQFEQLTNQQKANDLSGIQNTEDQRKLESASAMSKARSLLAELQRRQMAYMSATGNYSSSTADAFGEQFGRQAFSQLSDIQAQRDQALRQVEAERQKVNTFYSEKLLSAKQNYDKQLNYLNSQFLSQIDQINSAKGAAASAKRQASVDTWRNYTNAKLQLDNQLFQYKTQYDQWKAQMDQNLQSQAAVGDISAINPNYTNTQSMVGGVGATQNPTTQRTGYALKPLTGYEDLQNLMRTTSAVGQ